MSTLSPTRRYALLIGVGDYAAYDASTHSPANASALKGAEQDVASMYALCIELGILPENIRVLLSPSSGQDPLVALRGALSNANPGLVRPATREEILTQCQWLAAALASDEDASGAPAGLVTYSGHGDFDRGHLALCPSDVRSVEAGADLENVLGYPMLRALFSDRASSNLTVVLDCCHAAASTPAPRGGSSLTGRGRTATGPVVTISERTIIASSVGGTSEQSTFDGVAHGALTWAIKVVTDQWRLRRTAGGTELTLSYATLVSRVNALLGVLEFEQRAELAGFAGLGDLAFFHRGQTQGAPTSPRPDRARHGGQLEPDKNADYTHYTFKVFDANGATLLIAVAIAVRTTKQFGDRTYESGGEYLFVSPDSTSTWDDIIDGVGQPASAKFSPALGTWPQDNDPFPSAIEIGATDVNYSAVTIEGSPLNGRNFYNEIKGQTLCATGVQMLGTQSSPSFNWAILASQQPSADTYIVDSSGPTTFGQTSAPSESSCTCCASPSSCKWYKPTMQSLSR